MRSGECVSFPSVVAGDQVVFRNSQRRLVPILSSQTLLYSKSPTLDETKGMLILEHPIDKIWGGTMMPDAVEQVGCVAVAGGGRVYAVQTAMQEWYGFAVVIE